MRLLVCGGRNYADRKHINHVLNALHAAHPITCLIHGAASGVDSLAADWGRTTIGADNVDPYPADWSDTDHPDALIRWNKHGAYDARAGFRRNARMLALGRPDLVQVFPGGAGTASMIGLARAAKVAVQIEYIALDTPSHADTRLL